MRILALNGGSRSYRAHVYDVADLTLRDDVPAPLWQTELAWSALPGMAIERDASGERSVMLADVAAASTRILDRFVASDLRIEAIAHRVVRAGHEHDTDAIIDGAERAAIASAVDFAPDHNPLVLATIDAAAQCLPGVVQIAVCDSTFHNDLPAAAAAYAVPEEWRDAYGVRRVGFHGLSHAYCARRTEQLWGGLEHPLRIVSAHLGGGCSLAAIAGGRSVDTTMGFTPLDGLVMATRSGSIDPGIILYLLQHTSYTVASVDSALRHDSGLRALSGRSGDMREIVLARGSDPRARLAFEVFIHRLRGQIAAMAAAMGGLDALVFTGGVGQNSPEVREAAARRLEFLGIALEGARNHHVTPTDCEISLPKAAVRTFVIHAREEWEIARTARKVFMRASHGAHAGSVRST